MNWQPEGIQPDGYQPSGWQPDEAAATAPVWSAIPNQSSLLGTGTHTLDLDDYCTGATSYAVSDPVSLPTGWSLVGSIFTWDTDAVSVFGPYTVTATNAVGTADSNAFGVTVVSADVGAGRSKRIRNIYRITVDGQQFEFRSLAEALQFLEKTKRAAQELARQATRQATERQKAQAKPIPPPKFKPPEIKISSRELRGAVTETKREIEEIYRQAVIDAEVAMLFELEDREKHNEAVIWLM